MTNNKDTRLRPVGGDIPPRKGRGPLALAIKPEPHLAHFTDLGNAARLAARHGTTLRWVEGRGWFKWAGGVWALDTLEGQRRHIDTIRFYSHFGAEFERWANDSEEKRRVTAAVDLAKPFVPLDGNLLDRDPWLLNTQNGTVDLHTGELQLHAAEDLLTRITDIVYDPKATCPTFVGFIEQIFDGDQDLIGYVQRALGYSLIGGTTEQVLFICTGTGSNGKSTLLELVKELLGSYGRAIPASTLLHNPGHQPRYELADLPGVRFVTAVESDVDKKLAEGLVKSVTGSDTIAARQIYRSPFTFRPQFTLWIATNHLPRIDGTDHAIWRRLKVIPFDVTIPDAKQDKDLPMKLRAEAPGILQWVIDGALQYQERGLDEPAAVTEKVKQYRVSQDFVGQWIEDRCELDENAWTSTARLVDSYNHWADANALDTIKGASLGKRLSERDLRPGKQRGRRGWHGIHIKPMASDDAAAARSDPGEGG